VPALFITRWTKSADIVLLSPYLLNERDEAHAVRQQQKNTNSNLWRAGRIQVEGWH
jgi:hypothetical protein